MAKRVTWMLTALASVLAWVTARDIRLAMGGKPNPERMRRSAQFSHGKFHNRAALTMARPGALWQVLLELLRGGQPRRPTSSVPLVATPTTISRSGLYLTWYGHASTLVEIDGARILLDPIWADRCSPAKFLGPRRLHEPPVPLSHLPTLDAIVISHDHYDHLDLPTVRMLASTHGAPFVVPLGVGAHLRRWKIPADRIIELDWDEHVDLKGLRLTATPAQHFSGRGITNDWTLWASWVITGPRNRVFYTGDSGYFSGYSDIGRQYGPFDAVLVQIGAYNRNWPNVHMTPEEGVAAHLDVRGGLLVPVHWGTFVLATHGWAEPVNRVWREAKARDIQLAIPRPGERIDVHDPPSVDPWWVAAA